MQLPIISAPTNAEPLTAPQASGEARGSYAVISLGCPKNTVDTEQMLGQLHEFGYRLVDDPDGADFVVVNTCGFIDSARQESMGAIDEMLELKQQGKLRGVIVTGCLAERQRDQLLAARPEIDGMLGVFGRDDIVDVANRFVDGIAEQRTVFRPAPIQALPDNRRLGITPEHFAYLKISEGCDRLCTFCAIPKMRGKHASKPIEQVVAEARRMAESGVRELNVVAQDTTYYGLDLYGQTRLNELLQELDAIDGLDWIRLMYFYPMYIDDALLDTIASAKRIVPYIDMPLQHASDSMLRRMSRRVNRADTEVLLNKMRSRIDNLVMRTTFITGFPGETEQDVDQLYEFIEAHQFERLGIFTYSLEPDTPAAKLPDHVPADVAEARRARLMQLQQEMAFDWNQQRVGTQADVLIDRPLPDQPGVWIGRTAADAPDIDGLVFVSEQEAPLDQGVMVRSEIVASQGYDLVAVPTDTPR
ncbi:Ribosomal protein S12 methylthiotransferase RimO [Rosistilla carotiformis]|uniref:Ribosomal protein uS12 methylthiotransferase RimO n=1 Tax=Rosistilla carotiformis TaxID=2528017 RepID=A0A518JUZ4_9BACT|nr:30S ribosomal protein S12 methylthiotransferase RimO [Rosistilla carotiformis]QDV69362.1 Ribosomal protein S12 methylthiotransferase RimO [Rosistilla carotiformis]